jgi:hypothetical protein
MSKINALKGILYANELLSNSEMTSIIGGNNGNGNGNAFGQEKQATDDDKRRQRPGGGVSTL